MLDLPVISPREVVVKVTPGRTFQQAGVGAKTRSASFVPYLPLKKLWHDVEAFFYIFYNDDESRCFFYLKHFIV
ncbi:hypothetical protein [Clostridium aceticum]|uniref:hypothetical protein n=1 Tax=Clostridium aceticum TaxID=84022 RepID=UPI0005CF684A|nr:hypothetical protein [Clostridium aceticum]KJF25849.1 hypothetical protein TZ02_16805 [Clostridium aceticum]